MAKFGELGRLSPWSEDAFPLRPWHLKVLLPNSRSLTPSDFQIPDFLTSVSVSNNDLSVLGFASCKMLKKSMYPGAMGMVRVLNYMSWAFMSSKMLSQG